MPSPPPLSALPLNRSYRKGTDDIARDFYLPCMSRAQSYDRAVGFFNSTIYAIAWPSLREFVQRGGRMRVVCSPVLFPDDAEALAAGYAERVEKEVSERLRQEAISLLRDPFLQKPAKVLATLVAMEVLELRVAFIGEAERRRLFHDKVGIFFDAEGNAVVFKGSMNETSAGLSADGNLESVDVFLSWEGGKEAERVRDEIDYFEKLWTNTYPGVLVKPFPQVAKDELVAAADAAHLEQLIEDVCAQIEAAAKLSADGPKPSHRIPRPHQTQALLEWEARGRRGIFEHATGSGKTFTALCAIRESLGRDEVPVVLVPSELLLTQWHAEIRATLADMAPQILVCGGGNTHWRDEKLLGAWTRHRPGAKPRLVLSTMQTAATSDFRSGVAQGPHVFLVADEVHRLGSPEHQNILALDTGPRLGLSATPRRAGDPEGTRAIFDYFQGVIPPPFTLADAIRSGALTPYFYYVHKLELTDDEQSEWDELSVQAGQMYARLRSGKGDDVALAARLKNLLIKRARIVKAASQKTSLAAEVVEEHFQSGQQWLVYCDSVDQLRNVQAELSRRGIASTEYHSTMAGDRESTLRYFDANGGILVSIRCLDEGVDIPTVTHALVLASSQNPREFVQRRGRILRRAPNKALAHLHDAIVVPRAATDERPDLAVLESEMVRAIEFGKTAENPSAITDLERIALAFGVDRSKYFEGGMEDDESAD
jgi:superfamily II DNA or RNA helicase